MPGRHGFRCEPDRSTATLWQCLVVLVPVAHSIARLRDFVTTRFDGFKGHLISRTEAFALVNLTEKAPQGSMHQRRFPLSRKAALCPGQPVCKPQKKEPMAVL